MPRFRYECPLRWGDQDAYQHVNNAAYVILFEEVRARWMNDTAPDLLRSGVIVVRHEIDYLRPVTYRSTPVIIDLWVTEVRAAAFTIRYELFDGRPVGNGSVGNGSVDNGSVGNGSVDNGSGAVVACRAQSRMAPYDLVAGRPRRIDGEYREFLRSWADVPDWTSHR